MPTKGTAERTYAGGLGAREQWAKYRALERILGHPDGAVLYAKSEGIGMGELAARMCMRGSDLVKG